MLLCYYCYLPIEVEVGRYRQKSLNVRTRPFCKNEVHVEDEIHFIFNCMMYNHERNTLRLGTEETCKSRYNSDSKICYGTLPTKVGKISLECIYEAYRNVKVVTDNAGASKVNCLQDIVLACKPCWAGRTNRTLCYNLYV